MGRPAGGGVAGGCVGSRWVRERPVGARVGGGGYVVDRGWVRASSGE